MNLILSMSVSVNGMAARENDSTDFLAHGEWPLFVELSRDTGAMLWGRRTHEIVRGYGGDVLRAFDGIFRMVVSRDPSLAVEPGWHVATSPQEALTALSAAGLTQAVLGGGATLNTAFADAGLIDQVVVNVGPVLIGRGVPMFAPRASDVPLRLLETKHVGDEVVQLVYQVRPQT